MEDEPVLHLNVGGERQLEVRRDNSSLFRFFGEMAMYDHVFIVTDEDTNRGSFIFSVNSCFEELVDYMMTNDYPAHLNLPEVAECDRRAFEDMLSTQLTTDLEGGVPEDWA